MAIDFSIKVIVVDDMMTMRKIVSKNLKAMGFKNIVEAEDGAKAWSLLTQAADDGKPFGFIVSDWNMPKMDGLELLTKVRATDNLKETPFLMVTAEAESSNVLKVVKAGVSNFIVKPFTPDTLTGKVQKIFS
ncbi:MAG: response regulator [Gammaproteobacteria bacterium]|nr:response regulator [Gammaproteobacteria bacterium]